MAGGGRLHILAPGLLGPAPAQLREAVATRGRFPAIERLLGTAGRESAHSPESFAPWPDAFPGAGACGLLGAGGDPGDAVWYCADPVHLRADRDRLMVFGGTATALTSDEAAAVAEAFNSVFAEDGLWLAVAESSLFLRVPADRLAGEPVLAPTRVVCGRYMDTFLPEGPTSRNWRQLLNESQMMLHGLPLNDERITRQELAVNGLWFWGGGPLPQPVVPGEGVVLCATDPVLRGLALRAGGMVEATLDGLGSLSAITGETVTHCPDADAALCSGDLEGWFTALEQFDRAWAQEAERGLQDGRWSEVRVYPGGSPVFRRTARTRLRFWRRPRPLAALLEHP